LIRPRFAEPAGQPDPQSPVIQSVGTEIGSPALIFAGRFPETFGSRNFTTKHTTKLEFDKRSNRVGPGSLESAEAVKDWDTGFPNTFYAF